MNKNVSFVVGIDEAGRGPLAGPVCIGAVIIPKNIYQKIIRKVKKEGIRDSKKLSQKVRDIWLEKIISLKNRGEINYSFSLVSASVIDKIGINLAISLGIKRALAKIKANPANTQILFDGGLKAEKQFLFQQAFIKGDENKPIISMASIVAKVNRDNFMINLEKKFPKFSFSIHKGYGTKRHYDEIKLNGVSSFHRQTFLKSLK